MYIAKGGVLIGVEGLSCVQPAQTRRKGPIADAAVKRPQRAIRKCSMCELTEYTACTCPSAVRGEADFASGCGIKPNGSMVLVSKSKCKD